MFSVTEYSYIHDLLINYYNNDFKHYVCYTNNPTDYSNNNVYDIYCFVSKDVITFNNNHFNILSGKKISFDSNNYSSNNTIDKLLTENVDSTTLLYDSKEFYYSDIIGFPDITADYRTSLNNHLDLNYAFLIPCLLMLLFIVNFIKSCFRSRR